MQSFSRSLSELQHWRSRRSCDPISYGLNVFASFHHGANLCGKILKGARPGDLPIELTTKFKLVINLKTAKTLGTMIAP